MGTLLWTARRLSVHTSTKRENSEVFDLRDSCAVHVLVKVSNIGGTNPQIQVRGEHSIDGLHWEDLAGLSFESPIPITLEKSATSSAYRYLRFAYLLSGTNAHATFEVRLFGKTYGESPAPPAGADAAWQTMADGWQRVFASLRDGSPARGQRMTAAERDGGGCCAERSRDRATEAAPCRAAVC